MGFKQISDLSADVTISLGGTNKKTGKKNPVSVEGYYLGRREVPDPKKKSGVSYIYFFQTAEGNVGVWGKTDLDNKMSGVGIRTMTRASFERMAATQNGEMYKYRVEIDEDNTLELGAGNNGSSNLGYNEGEEVDGDAAPTGDPANKASQTAALLKGRNSAKRSSN